MAYISSAKHDLDYFKAFKNKFDEQIRTGGVTICFGSHEFSQTYAYSNYVIGNYFFCPFDLGIVNEKGDTFNLKYEELKYFNPLFNKTCTADITWIAIFPNPQWEQKFSEQTGQATQSSWKFHGELGNLCCCLDLRIGKKLFQ